MIYDGNKRVKSHIAEIKQITRIQRNKWYESNIYEQANTKHIGKIILKKYSKKGDLREYLKSPNFFVKYIEKYNI